MLRLLSQQQFYHELPQGCLDISLMCGTALCLSAHLCEAGTIDWGVYGGGGGEQRVLVESQQAFLLLEFPRQLNYLRRDWP